MLSGILELVNDSVFNDSDYVLTLYNYKARGPSDVGLCTFQGNILIG